MQRNLFSDYGGSFDAKHLARPTQMNFGHLPTIQGLRRNHGSLLKAGCLGNLFLRLVGLLSKEAHQCGVYFFRVCPRDAVWTVLHDQLACSFDELDGAQSCSRDGKDAVGITVNHQRWHIDTGQILAEVFVPSCDTPQTGGGGGAGRRVPVGLEACSLTRFPRKTSVL